MKVPGKKPIQECGVIVLEIAVCSTKQGRKRRHEIQEIQTIGDATMRNSNEKPRKLFLKERERWGLYSNSPGGLLTRKNNETDTLLHTFKCNREFMVLLRSVQKIEK